MDKARLISRARRAIPFLLCIPVWAAAAACAPAPAPPPKYTAEMADPGNLIKVRMSRFPQRSTVGTGSFEIQSQLAANAPVGQWRRMRVHGEARPGAGLTLAGAGGDIAMTWTELIDTPFSTFWSGSGDKDAPNLPNIGAWATSTTNGTFINPAAVGTTYTFKAWLEAWYGGEDPTTWQRRETGMIEQTIFIGPPPRKQGNPGAGGARIGISDMEGYASWVGAGPMPIEVAVEVPEGVTVENGTVTLTATTASGSIVNLIDNPNAPPDYFTLAGGSATLGTVTGTRLAQFLVDVLDVPVPDDFLILEVTFTYTYTGSNGLETSSSTVSTVLELWGGDPIGIGGG